MNRESESEVDKGVAVGGFANASAERRGENAHNRKQKNKGDTLDSHLMEMKMILDERGQLIYMQSLLSAYVGEIKDRCGC